MPPDRPKYPEYLIVPSLDELVEVRVEFSERYRELKEKFKKGFLGIAEVERAFTLQNGAKLIELTEAQREEALRALEAKIAEPDIQEFLRATPDETLARDWLLVLRIPQLQDNTPLTMQALEERLAPDLVAQGQGKLLYSVDWYKDENFYTQDTVQGGLHWQLTTRKVVLATKGRKHPDQIPELQNAARAAKLDPAKTRRRAPVETLYDAATALRATGTRILTHEDDWSDVQTSAGRFVSIGYASAEGACVDGDGPGGSDGSLGASLSR